MKDYRTRFTHIWQLISKPIQEFKVIVNGYRIYSALLSQEGTNAPVATVLENSIGNIAWTRDGIGLYIGTLVDSFPNNSTAAITSDSAWNNAGVTYITVATSTSPSDFISIETKNLSGVYSDDVLAYTYVEIKIYNKK
jgi:hypothetical protein